MTKSNMVTECIPGPAAGPAERPDAPGSWFCPSWLEPTEGSTPPSWLEPAEGSIPAAVLCSFIGSGLAPNPVFCHLMA